MTTNTSKPATDKQRPLAGVPDICIHANIPQQIRHHGRSSLNAEVGGILLGKISGTTTVVDALIPADKATSGGTHVTFTQDAWEDIYKIKDAQYPESRIVGWYHTHPGFGIFLSEYDLFIHRNFFSDPQQIAWVFDPLSDEEGCFVWSNSDIARQHVLRILPPSKETPCPTSPGADAPRVPSDDASQSPRPPTSNAGGLHCTPFGLLTVTAFVLFLALLLYLATVNTVSYRLIKANSQPILPVCDHTSRYSTALEKCAQPVHPQTSVSNDFEQEAVTEIEQQVDVQVVHETETPSLDTEKEMPDDR